MNYDDVIRMIQNAIAHRHEAYADCRKSAEDRANEQAIEILRAAKKVMHAAHYLEQVAL